MTIANPQIKSVAIIGGGASGAIAIKSLKSFGPDVFSNVVLFERRSKLGGVWIYDENPGELVVKPGSDGSEFVSGREIPSEIFDINNNGEFIKQSLVKTTYQDQIMFTPTYERMTTNVPELVMTFSDAVKWPKDENEDKDLDSTFVSHRKVQRYIEQYFKPFENFVQYSTSVEQVTKDDVTGKWRIVTVTLQENENSNSSNPSSKLEVWRIYEFDAVIVATGHYNVPSIPHVEGIDIIHQKSPERIRHSKHYRNPEVYRDKSVIVVGSRASGSDIVKEISSEAKHVYISRRASGGPTVSADPSSYTQKGLISRYEVTDSSDPNNLKFNVIFEDGSVVSNPDEVVYATGYKFSYPFLNRFDINLTTGNRNPTLYQHIFYRDDPSLAFIGIPIDGISFRIFEYQAVLVGRVFAGLVELPPLHEQQEWLNIRGKLFGDTRAYHTLGFDDAENYMNSLVKIGGGVVSPAGDGKGDREFPIFGEYERSTVLAVKEKLAKLWDNRS